MPNQIRAATGPLGNLSVEEIEFLLRGFPDTAITSSLALRTLNKPSDIESCLLGILKFYLPTGVQPCEINEVGTIRIKEDLGLDSLSIAESMFKVEEVFGVYLDAAEYSEIETIADASRMLMQKLAGPELCSNA